MSEVCELGVSSLPSRPSRAATRETHSSSALFQGYFPPSSMSLSPTDSTLASPVIPSKRRRAHTNQQSLLMDESSTASGATPGHIPKRGARACTACRKGKNRCEGEVSNLSVRAVPRPAHRARWPVSTAPARDNNVQAPCRRCQLSGQPCIFEKPEKKNGQLLSTASVE